MAYCKQKNYACANNPKWPYKIDVFSNMDPEGLARYENEVYGVYEAQGIDLEYVVWLKQNNPLKMEGMKNTLVLMLNTTKANPVMTYFLQGMGLKAESISNYEVYYIVKMIEQNKPTFYGAIDRCGEWCFGSWGRWR